MITLTCTGCNTSLSLDEAFAGGVCRCQHCGTIQTVPARLKQQKPTKTLYRNRHREAAFGSGTGLEQLTDVATSSGLSSGLMNQLPPAMLDHRPAAAPKPKWPQWLLIVLAIVAAVLLVSLGGALALYFVAR